MDDLGRWHGVVDQIKQIQFFAAERRIVFIDTKHKECGYRIELEPEVGITETISERLHIDYPATRKYRANDLFQEMCGKRAARLRSEPPRLNWRAMDHRPIIPDFSGQRAGSDQNRLNQTRANRAGLIVPAEPGATRNPFSLETDLLCLS
jgi:hypothetical protein